MAARWVVYLAVGGLLTAGYLWLPPLKANGPLINLLGLSSSVAIAVGIYLHRPKARAAWMLVIVGQFLFFAGDLYTYSYPKLFGVEVEFPSLGDAIYLTVYPALVVGLLMLVRRRNPQGDRAGVIDSLILTVGIALLSWVFLVAPNIHLSGLTLLEKGVSAAYPLGDILLLAAVIRLAVDKGKRAPAFYLLVGSIVSLLAVDSAYTYALLDGRVQPPAELRRRLDRLLPALGRGRAPPLDAHARGTRARVARAPHPAPARAARGSLSDRARRPVLPGARRPRRPRADRGVGAAVPARRRPHGRPRAPGGAGGSARAGTATGGRRARRRRRS